MPARHPELTQIERARRQARIGRLRKDGVPWKTVAEQVGLSMSQAKEIYRQWAASQDALENVAEDIEDYDLQWNTVLQIAWQQYEDTEPGSTQRNTAIKNVMEALERQILFRQRIGLLPQALSWPQWQAALQELLAEVGSVFERYDVPAEAMQDLMSVAEERLGPRRTIAVQAGR